MCFFLLLLDVCEKVSLWELNIQGGKTLVLYLVEKHTTFGK